MTTTPTIPIPFLAAVALLVLALVLHQARWR